MQRGTIIRVFVASPGDVSEQREAITRIVHEWNHIHSKDGVIAEPIRWETHAHAAAGESPQKIINRQLLEAYDCDILVALFWSRLGTATDTHEAATLEEIEKFSTLHGSKDRVMIFFCQWPIPFKAPADQRDKVMAFQAKAQEWAICPTIDTDAQFEPIVRRHLHQVLNDVIHSPEFVALRDRETAPAKPPSDFSVTNFCLRVGFKPKEDHTPGRLTFEMTGICVKQNSHDVHMACFGLQNVDRWDRCGERTHDTWQLGEIRIKQPGNSSPRQKVKIKDDDLFVYSYEYRFDSMPSDSDLWDRHQFNFFADSVRVELAVPSGWRAEVTRGDEILRSQEVVETQEKRLIYYRPGPWCPNDTFVWRLLSGVHEDGRSLQEKGSR